MESLNNSVEHVCNKKAFCTHDKRKSTCKECGGRGLCKVPLCETIGNPRYKGQCVCCFIHLFPDEKNVHNYKAKESTVATHRKEKFPGVTWVCDKPVKDGYSKRRPDLFLDMGSHVLIVDIDEDQHKTYDCTCENRRLVEISKDVNHHPVVMVRLNPDGYVRPEKGKIPSPWADTEQGVSVVL